jgi:hypothetical protein
MGDRITTAARLLIADTILTSRAAVEILVDTLRPTRTTPFFPTIVRVLPAD